jgi:hypothetical protein
LGFNFNIFSSGGGGGGGQGIAKYPTAASLPGSAADGDIAIVLDTNDLYSYDTGVNAWVIIGGPGVAISVADTSSVDLSLTGNVLTAALNITGVTNPVNSWGISLVNGASGLFGYLRGYPIGPAGTSNMFTITGQTGTVLGGSLSIDIAAAGAAQAGVVTASSQSFGGPKFFNNIVTGFSGFGLVSGAGGPGTIFLNAPNSVPSSYNWILPSAQGGTWLVLTNDGQGNLSWSAGSSAAQMSVGPFSYVSYAQGATIFGPTFQLGWADLTNPGSVGTTTQQFAGLKLFNNNIVSPTVSGATAASGNLILDSTTNSTPGNILLARLMGASGTIGIGMTTPQAAIHYAAGVLNRTAGVVGADAVILGRISTSNAIGAGAFVIGGHNSSGENEASARSSFAAGEGVAARGVGSFAWGSAAVVSSNADYGLAMGRAATVAGSALYAVSIGDNSRVNGNMAVSLGNGTIAQPQGGVALGRFNVAAGSTAAYVATDQVAVIGNGVATGTRKNAWAITGEPFQQWYGASSGFLSIAAGLSSAGYTLMMPAAQGSTNTFLKNDGQGNLTWTAAGNGNIVSVANADASLLTTTGFVEYTTGASDRTLTLYAAAGNTSLSFDIMKIDSGLGRVIVQSNDLINGVTNFYINAQWECHRFICNGLGFRVLT